MAGVFSKRTNPLRVFAVSDREQLFHDDWGNWAARCRQVNHHERSPGLAKIFGKDLNLGRPSVGLAVGVSNSKVDERTWEQRSAVGGTSLLPSV
jgi:hypothetical protein